MFRTLASRLTFLYLLLFSILSLVVFLLVSYSLKVHLVNRIDQELHDDSHEFLGIYQQEGLNALAREIRLETEGEGTKKIFIRVYAPNRTIVETSDTHEWEGLPAPPPLFDTLPMAKFETITLSGSSERARIFYQPLGDGNILQSGMLLTSDEKLLANFQWIFAAVFLGILICGGFIGFYISKRALSGVERVRETADQISRGNLSQPISFQDKTLEINNLISAINRMQKRIHSLIRELQDVTNNIAHDLRSPVTRMRGLAETTLTGEQSIEEYRGLAGAVVEECDSLVGMINTMLEIAETDAEIKPLACKPVNITDIIRDVAELYLPVAEDKNINLSLRVMSDSLIVPGDRSRLQRALANLLDNALKFTQIGGRVTLSVKKEGDDASITISDTGPGICAADLPHICERFYRADRSRSTTGTGLGLSLVQSIVLAHKGTINITSQENAGTQVEIFLPMITQ